MAFDGTVRDRVAEKIGGILGVSTPVAGAAAPPCLQGSSAPGHESLQLLGKLPSGASLTLLGQHDAFSCCSNLSTQLQIANSRIGTRCRVSKT
jgi:hypothetical protein